MTFSLRIIGFCSFLLIFSCKEKKQNISATATSIRDTANYFPIQSFIEEQGNFVNLRNFVITKTATTQNNFRKDTITKEEFTTHLLAFKQAIEYFSKHKTAYKETVFQDLGTDSYTLNYQSTDPLLSIQRIDILLRAETNTVKQLFIRGYEQKNDTGIIKQFSFWADKKMEISTEYTIGNAKPIREINRIEWIKAVD